MGREKRAKMNLTNMKTSKADKETGRERERERGNLIERGQAEEGDEMRRLKS